MNKVRASPAKLAHNVFQKFKKNDRFTGKPGENILNYFDSYDEAMRDHNVSHGLKNTIFPIWLKMMQRYFTRNRSSLTI